jgi:hypothetical protein
MCCYYQRNIYFVTSCYQQYVQPEQVLILENDQVGYSRIAGSALHYHLRLLELTTISYSDIQASSKNTTESSYRHSHRECATFPRCVSQQFRKANTKHVRATELSGRREHAGSPISPPGIHHAGLKIPPCEWELVARESSIIPDHSRPSDELLPSFPASEVLERTTESYVYFCDAPCGVQTNVKDDNSRPAYCCHRNAIVKLCALHST